MSNKTYADDLAYIERMDQPFRSLFPQGIVRFPTDTTKLDSLKVSSEALKALRAQRYRGAIRRIHRRVLAMQRAGHNWKHIDLHDELRQQALVRNIHLEIDGDTEHYE